MEGDDFELQSSCFFIPATVFQACVTIYICNEKSLRQLLYYAIYKVYICIYKFIYI